MVVYWYSIIDSPFMEQLSAILAGENIRLQPVRLSGDFAFSLAGDRQLRSGDIIILLLASPMEIEQFLKIRELLADFRLIILLTDNREEMVTRAHALMPRFLSTIEEDIGETVRVIERMVRRSAHQKTIGQARQTITQRQP